MEKIEKRYRSPNFTEEEKLCLCSIISNFSDIIEDKKTDRATFTKKLEAWKIVEEQFNSRCPSSYHRDWSVLKRLYENKKKDVRKLKAQETQELFRTGGGPGTVKSNGNPMNEILLSIMNEKSVYGLGNTKDSNCSRTPLAAIDIDNEKENSFELIDIDAYNNNDDAYNNNDDDNNNNNEYIQRNVIVEPEEVAEARPNWKKHCADDLRTSTSKELRVTSKKSSSRRRPPLKALTTSHLAAKYEDILDTRKNLLEMELKFKKEEYALQLEKLKLEIEEKRRALLNNED